MDTRFGTWNVKSLYTTGLLKTVARELRMYKVKLNGSTGGEIGEGGTERVEDYAFFCGEENGDLQLGTGFFVHKRIVSAVRRVEFISDTMSYIILRGRWSSIMCTHL
jgi:hypothetical protein